MAGRKLDPADIPTLGPWQVGEAEADAPPELGMSGIEPTSNDGLGGRAYLIRQARPIEPGEDMPIALGIQRLADARLIAAAPELADALVRLLTSPELNRQDIDPSTQRVRDTAWVVLMRVAPHLEIGAWT